jgi:hypothetical protein
VEDEGWRDAYIEWTFDLGNSPPGNLEVWERDVNNADHVVATLPIEQRSFWHYSVNTDPIDAYYRVRYIYGLDVVGPFSNEFLVHLDDPLGAPDALGAAALGSDQVSLTWDMTGVNGEDGCWIEARIDATPFAPMWQTAPDQASLTVNLSEPGYWEFRIRAYRGEFYSDYSNVASVDVY